MKIFYHKNPEESDTLPEDEGLHALKVLRLKAGDEIKIIDGKNSIYIATLIQATGKKCQYRILSKETIAPKRDYRLHIAVAPTKSIDRTEWWVEKAIEVGIDEISFIQCAHSERKNINLERIEKIAISALKQSMNLNLPIINPFISLHAFLLKAKASGKFIAHLADDNRLTFKNEILLQKDILLLIGPEGDFSPEEIALALQHQYTPVSLGESRLRTETAALAGCFICHTVKTP